MRTVYPIGTTVYNPPKCWGGYTILNGYLRKGRHATACVMQSGTNEESIEDSGSKSAPFEKSEISVIDMNGNFVHGWDLGAMRCPTLFENGNLLAARSAESKLVLPWKAFPQPHKIRTSN